MSHDDSSRDPKVLRQSRRTFFTNCARGCALALLGGGGAAAAIAKARQDHAGKSRTVWQIDPEKCTQCGLCATSCVLKVSAAKCVNDMAVPCGYCEVCFGYFRPDYLQTETSAENQMCPVGAIHRKQVEGVYYEYTILEEKCIGCALCVKGCLQFGNASLYLQIRHDRCLNCNQCSIATACPADAVVRVPADHPYILKSKGPLKT